ncbi:hypothetical protein ZWY2020_007432 [Hordeum vulgare]|nr:hypothetical protein ZWY2020_007432 [Hordeum vulgare]
MEGKLPCVAVFTEVGKQLFRSVQVIGAWQLEVAAGSIARRIGLQLPSVNLYAIAQCYLNELALSVERILPHACCIYEWAMPPKLCLSSNPVRVPTWVCVMAILILALRLQYTINGQGVWEVRLLCTLADAYGKSDVAHGNYYSKDLHSYLKYCKDVVFPRIACSVEEDHLIGIFQIYTKDERCFSASSSGILSIESETEDQGFCYMPPTPSKCPSSDGYLHYRKKTITGSLVCVGHADYYMLIRSFSKLAEVDIRVVHASVLKLKRRLAWIEEIIGGSSWIPCGIYLAKQMMRKDMFQAAFFMDCQFAKSVNWPRVIDLLSRKEIMFVVRVS